MFNERCFIDIVDLAIVNNDVLTLFTSVVRYRIKTVSSLFSSDYIIYIVDIAMMYDIGSTSRRYGILYNYEYCVLYVDHIVDIAIVYNMESVSC